MYNNVILNTLPIKELVKCLMSSYVADQGPIMALTIAAHTTNFCSYAALVLFFLKASTRMGDSDEHISYPTLNVLVKAFRLK